MQPEIHQKLKIGSRNQQRAEDSTSHPVELPATQPTLTEDLAQTSVPYKRSCTAMLKT